MPSGYGILTAPRHSELARWDEVRERLTGAHNYWVVTTRPDGRPHAMPVWGLWFGERFYFATDRESRKARNMVANAAVVVHLESGDDVAILEGAAERVVGDAECAAFDAAYLAKYGVSTSGVPGDVSVWAVTPRVAFAWHERDFPGTATRWRFSGPA